MYRLADGEIDIDGARAEIKRQTDQTHDLKPFTDSQEGFLLELILKEEIPPDQGIYQLNMYKAALEDAAALDQDDGFSLADMWDD
jgi:hypothetical protein